jgi:hypothetical protein
MSNSTHELVGITQELLNSIACADWNTYAKLCHSSLTAFEPEGRGHLIEGLPFHKHYFDLGAAKTAPKNSISSPHVRVLGDIGIICYSRLTQTFDEQGKPITRVSEETRIWQKMDGKWMHIHFHRSLPA